MFVKLTLAENDSESRKPVRVNPTEIRAYTEIERGYEYADMVDGAGNTQSIKRPVFKTVISFTDGKDAIIVDETPEMIDAAIEKALYSANRVVIDVASDIKAEVANLTDFVDLLFKKDVDETPPKA